MEEREIDLLDMLLSIVLHWRGIIVLMLLGGILLGSYSYIRSDREVKAHLSQMEQINASLMELGEEEALEARKQMLEEELTETQKVNVRTVIAYEQYYQDYESYLDQSLRMQLDAACVPVGQVIFAVTAESLEDAVSIACAYQGILSSGGLGNYLAEQMGLDPVALSELYAVGGVDLAGLSLEENSFRVTVIYPDQEICEKMMQTVIAYAKDQTNALNQSLGSHELVVLGQYYSERIDTGVISQRKSYVDQLISLDAANAKAKDAFTDEERAYYDILTGASDEESDTEEAAGDAENDESQVQEAAVGSAHVSLKYILVGIVLFAFLYVVVIAVIYILDNRIKFNDDLQELYKIPGLGKIPGMAKGKPLQFIDNWILTLWNRNKRQFTAEEAINLAAVAVKIAAKQGGLSAVSLVGCNMKEGAAAVCEQLKAVLEKDGIAVYILDNILYDAEALENLNNAAASVLVEKAASTFYSELEQEISLLKRQNVQILGVILAQ